MIASDMLERIVAYFGRDKDYNRARMDQLDRMIHAIDEQERERVMDKLIEEHESSRMLSVKNLAETCRGLGVSHHDRRAANFAEAIDAECGCCGESYKWKASASDFERLEGIHATCPKCGWPHSDEIRYRTYEHLGLAPDAAYRKTYKQQTDHLRNEHVGPDKKPAWSKAQARIEYSAKTKDEIDKVREEIAKIAEAKNVRTTA